MSKHLIRLNTPNTWPKILKKQVKFATKPGAGPHKLEQAITIQLALQELGLVQTRKEAKKVLNAGKVKVDGRIIKELNFPTGLFDVITIEDKKYNILIDKQGRITIKECKNDKRKLCKITGKRTTKGGLIQLNLHDGRNVLVPKDSVYKTGETVILEIPHQKITGKLELKKGAKIMLIKGKHAGDEGKLEEIKENKIVYKNKEGKQIETLKEYAFAITEVPE